MSHKAEIPESYFESRFEFAKPILENWNSPVSIVGKLLPSISPLGVGLGNVTWEKDPKTFQDISISFNFAKVNAALRIGLDSAICSAINPDWGDAPALLNVFGIGISALKENLKLSIVNVDSSLAFHVQCEEIEVLAKVANFVKPDILGAADCYGVSVYTDNFNFVIDRSLRYPKALFVRIFRKFKGDVLLEELAAKLLQDETDILDKLDLTEF